MENARRYLAGVALEGMVHQTPVENVGQLAVNTHGYTDFAMGLGKLRARFRGIIQALGMRWPTKRAQ